MLKTLLYCLLSLLLGIGIGNNLGRGSMGSEPAEQPPLLAAETPENFEEDTNGVHVQYYILVGAWSKPYFLNQVKHKLQTRGYQLQTYAKKIKRVATEVVEVGPFLSDEAARRHSQKIEQDLAVKTQIKPRIISN